MYVFFHPTFRIRGLMEYFRGPRVERSVEIGRKAIKQIETDVSMTTVHTVIPQTSWWSMYALNTQAMLFT